MKLAISTVDDAKYVPGRRSFLEYRDLGVTDATGGRMRAQVRYAEQGLVDTGRTFKDPPGLYSRVGSEEPGR